MKVIVNFENVIKQYKTKPALNKLSFYIYENEFVALVGNNGCGKTTTINCLCNLIKYDSGNIYVFDKKVVPDYVSYKNRLGMLLSKPYFIDSFNIMDYWKFICKFQKVQSTSILGTINELLSILGLESSNNRKIKDLSSGEQMKVAIGAAFIHNPELLVLDEPFVNLDVQTTEKLTYLINSYKGKKTLFITSHNLNLVAEICDRFLIVDKGEIVANIPKTDFDNNIDLISYMKKYLLDSNLNINPVWLK